MNPTNITDAMRKAVGFFSLGMKLVYEKENSEFKQGLISLKIALVSCLQLRRG